MAEAGGRVCSCGHPESSHDRFGCHYGGCPCPRFDPLPSLAENFKEVIDLVRLAIELHPQLKMYWYYSPRGHRRYLMPTRVGKSRRYSTGTLKGDTEAAPVGLGSGSAAPSNPSGIGRGAVQAAPRNQREASWATSPHGRGGLLAPGRGRRLPFSINDLHPTRNQDAHAYPLDGYAPALKNVASPRARGIYVR